MSMMNKINAELQVLASDASEEFNEAWYQELTALYWNWFMRMVERYERDMEIING